MSEKWKHLDYDIYASKVDFTPPVVSALSESLPSIA
jgi:hypothetical protein